MKVGPKDAQKNRERILKAAASKLFRERSAKAVSVARVCEAAGLGDVLPMAGGERRADSTDHAFAGMAWQ